jgi:hypothetical protein
MLVLSKGYEALRDYFYDDDYIDCVGDIPLEGRSLPSLPRRSISLVFILGRGWVLLVNTS